MRYRALTSEILLIVIFPWTLAHVCRAATARAAALAYPEIMALSSAAGFAVPRLIVWADGARE